MSIQWQPGRPSRPRRPPLTKRMRPRQWMALDFLAAVPCLLVFFFTISKTISSPGEQFPFLLKYLLSAVLALGLAAPVALRRRGPLVALAGGTGIAVLITLIALASNGGLSKASVLESAAGFLAPAAYVIYLVAAWYQRRTSVAALAIVLALLVVDGVIVVLLAGTAPAGAMFAALIVIIFWGAGYAAGQRRAYAAQLQEQAAAGAVNEERLRIARELHDVVAHSMTVVAVQAGYGLHVIEGQPAKAGEALGAIQATTREALAEMRRMLGVLRHGSGPPFGANNDEADGHRASPAEPETASAAMTNSGAAGGNGAAMRGEAARWEAGTLGGAERGLRFRAVAGPAGTADGGAAPLAPAPGLADLGRLVARIGNAGVRVDLRIDGERRELPPGIDLAAFRIVQEALTNVVKHAGVTECGVTIGYQEDQLTVEITDEGEGGRVPAAAGGAERQAAGLSGEGGGHGLIGMRERVSMYGGELSAGPRPERGFRVAARLPIEDETP